MAFKVTKYLKVHGTEAQIKSLIQLAKLHKFEAFDATPIVEKWEAAYVEDLDIEY